jgi:hypothetical protein
VLKDPDRSEQRRLVGAVGDDEQRRPGDAVLVERPESDQEDADVDDRGEGEHPLQMVLSDAHHPAEQGGVGAAGDQDQADVGAVLPERVGERGEPDPAGPVVRGER